MSAATGSAVQAPTVPRLLPELAPAGTWIGIAEHRRRAGAIPQPGRQPRDDLITAVERAGLRGRGGAAFPTGTKLRAVASGRKRAVVVVNGTEGEPASGKDKLLLTHAPHLIIDGALTAAAAVGAGCIYICVERSATDAIAAVQRALAERSATEATLVPVHIATTPPRYVAGEESALVHWLNGGDARPTAVPPRPYERGVGGRPTLVDNAETIAHLALIGRHGPAWFREAGTADEPGTALLTITHAGGRRAIVEAVLGAPLRDVLDGAGADALDTQAVLIGGYFGTWVPGSHVDDIRLANANLRSLGASLGCGVVAALPKGTCGLSETARVVRWLAAESAGQCGPCVHGLAAIAGTLEAVAAGRAKGDAVQRLRRWAGQVEGRGACRHPDGAVRLVRSALSVFATDAERHLTGRRCAGAGATPVLPVPSGQGGNQWR